MKKCLFVVLAVAVLFGPGCKSKNNNPAPSPGADSYLPLTKGSTWSYQDDVSTTSGNITVTMTGATASFNGKTYYVANTVSDKGGAYTYYFYEGSHMYVTRGAYMVAGSSVELQMANDNVASGYTWTTVPTDDGQLEGATAKTINTVKETNLTKTVNGRTFTNVIHTQVDLQLNSESDAIYDIYLAKGVGLIQRDVHAYGLLVSSQTITSCSIK
jgi:hypothetical protein